jgi:hypothetical protein
MNTGVLAAIAGAIVVIVGLTIFMATRSRHHNAGGAKQSKQSGNQPAGEPLQEAAIEEVSHLFNDEFREELRNRGRLHFEKIIAENAMFLKQDLDMTIAQLNEHLKKEIGGKLDAEFDSYAKAMKEAQELALASLQRSATTMETQQQQLAAAFKQDLDSRQNQLITSFEQNMAKIIEQYLLQALSDQIDLKTQLPLIISQMEANKQDIMSDMRL